jgi:SAM-dependent methyltransferase
MPPVTAAADRPSPGPEQATPDHGARAEGAFAGPPEEHRSEHAAGTARSDQHAGADHTGSAPLREFYENPEVPASSGLDRAQRMAGMLSLALRGVSAPACILDVGCGDGMAAGIAAQHNPGHRMIGLDWSAGSLRRARRLGLAVVRAGVDRPGLPVASQAADVVIMSELIEHLVDTDSALDEVHRVLKPGGSLLLSTPNLAAWYNRGLVALGVQPVFSEVSLRGVYGRPGSQVAGHLHLFTRRALVQLLEARGFGRVRVTGARYHDVPAPLRPLDRAFCAWPAAASILLVHARKT